MDYLNHNNWIWIWVRIRWKAGRLKAALHPHVSLSTTSVWTGPETCVFTSGFEQVATEVGASLKKTCSCRTLLVKPGLALNQSLNAAQDGLRLWKMNHDKKQWQSVNWPAYRRVSVKWWPGPSEHGSVHVQASGLDEGITQSTFWLVGELLYLSH